jgi:CHAT domain-containing protein/Flp pilus assembly protein TadD
MNNTRYLHPTKAILLLTVALMLLSLITVQAQGQAAPTPPSQRDAKIEEARSLSKEVVTLIARGEYDEALRKAMRALEIRQRIFGIEHPDVASALVNIAYIYFKKNDYAKARELYTQALAIQEKTPGPDSPETANTLNNFALLDHMEGDPYTAEQLYKRALTILEKSVRSEQSQAATVMSNLGLISYNRGDYEEAEKLFQRALTTQEQALGEENGTLSTTLANLALAQYQKGKYNDAIKLLNRAVDITGKNFKEDPPDALPVFSLLVMSHVQAGSFDKAEDANRRALALIEKHPDVNSFYVIGGYISSGMFYKVKGDYKQAESLLRHALDTMEKTFGTENQTGAEALSQLGRLYVEQDDYARAEDMLRHALSLRRNIFGSGHPHYATSLVYLADLYERKGEYAKAEPMLKEALAIYKKEYGEGHPYVALVLGHLGAVAVANGDYETAKSMVNRSYDTLRVTLGREHPETLAAMSHRAELDWTLGSFTEAEELFQQMLAGFKKTLGPRHPLTATAMHTLGLFYYRRDKPFDAEPLLWEALNIRAQALRPGHRDIALSVRALSNLYEWPGGWHRYEAFLPKAVGLIEASPAAGGLPLAQMLNSVGTLLRWNGEKRKAESYFLRAVAICEQLSGGDQTELAAGLYNLARLYHSRGQLDKAEPLYERAVGILEKSQGPKPPALASYLASLSYFNAKKGDITRAVDFASRAAEVEDYNLNLMLARGSETQDRSYWTTLFGSTSRIISLHTREAPNDKDAARLALTTVLRRKGRVLDSMTESVQALRGRLSQPDRELLDKLAAARARLAAMVSQNPDKSGTGYNPAIASKLEEEYQRLEAAVSASSTTIREQSQPMTIESVQKLIPEGAVLIEFVSYYPLDKPLKVGDHFGRRYAVYVLGREGDAASSDLGMAYTIDDLILNLRIALRDPESESVKRLARAIDEKVMRPVRRLSDNAKWLLLSPDDTLNLIPFEALVDEQGHYLAENYLFTYLSSARELQRLQLPAPGREPPLIVADPDFGTGIPAEKPTPDGPGARSAATSRPAAVTYQPLTGTEEEASQIAKILPRSRVLTGTAATEAALKNVHGPVILHLATHGFFLKTVPWGPDSLNLTKINGKEVFKPTIINTQLEFYREREGIEHIYDLSRSGVVLAGANRREGGYGEDGILTSFEVSGLDLWGTKLVVLSACETAVGDVESGNGVYGLRRAVALAGAESQVMSLWKVDDRVTRDIMLAFYTRLRAGEGRSEALSHVRLDMLKSERYRHPYYWASFIQSGDWKSIDLRSN